MCLWHAGKVLVEINCSSNESINLLFCHKVEERTLESRVLLCLFFCTFFNKIEFYRSPKCWTHMLLFLYNKRLDIYYGLYKLLVTT